MGVFEEVFEVRCPEGQGLGGFDRRQGGRGPSKGETFQQGNFDRYGALR